MGKYNSASTIKKTAHRYGGFTIVELVLVVTVIGILAGISVVGYGAWRKNTAVNQLKSELNGVATAMESAKNFGNGYPVSIPSTFIPTSDVTLTYVNGDSTTYCIEARTTQDTSLVYKYNIAQKKEPQSGPCVVQIVSNLVHNPNPTSGTYWKSSSTGVMTLSFITSGAYNAVRSTRVGTAAAALYAERNGTGMVTGSTGDKNTVLFTISSNITTTLTFQIGYGTSTSATTTLPGIDIPVNLTANVPVSRQETFVVPSGITSQPLYFKLLWAANTGAVNDYFDVYKVMWVTGSYTGAYSDGYNTSAGWSWTGAVNTSTSTGPSL